MQISAVTADTLRATKTTDSPELMQLARKLEAGFLAQMFKHSGAGAARENFGGGAGESQFSSFLVQEYANAIADAGGLGLAESIYRSLVQREAQP